MAAGLTLRCQRFRADGSECSNVTTYVDAWCRQVDCPGFIRARAENAPESFGGSRGSSKHIRETGSTPIDLEFDDLDAVRLSARSVDSFRFHHGGLIAGAEAQLRSMLEDFLLRSARRLRNGYVVLARDGYQLVLSSDLTTITGYSTVHRERTWAQVRAGVKSRFRGVPGRGPSGDQPEPGPELMRSAVPTAMDPSSAYLTGRARASYAKLSNLRDVDDIELDLRLRAALTTIGQGRVDHARVGRGVDVIAAGLRWLISDDARTVVGVARAP